MSERLTVSVRLIRESIRREDWLWRACRQHSGRGVHSAALPVIDMLDAAASLLAVRSCTARPGRDAGTSCGDREDRQPATAKMGQTRRDAARRPAGHLDQIASFGH